MRIDEARNRASSGARRRERPRFDEALRLAARRAGAELPTRATRPADARRSSADRDGVVLSERRDGVREEQRAAAPPPPVGAHGPEAGPPSAELRALARALPVAVHAAALRAGAPLSLAFGRSLDVELRSTPRGVDLILHAERRLEATCSEGLPALVAALARRGVVVARAEVHPRRGARYAAR